jgi:hypothetical protein
VKRNMGMTINWGSHSQWGSKCSKLLRIPGDLDVQPMLQVACVAKLQSAT